MSICLYREGAAIHAHKSWWTRGEVIPRIFQYWTIVFLKRVFTFSRVVYLLTNMDTNVEGQAVWSGPWKLVTQSKVYSIKFMVNTNIVIKSNTHNIRESISTKQHVNGGGDESRKHCQSECSGPVEPHLDCSLWDLISGSQSVSYVKCHPNSACSCCLGEFRHKTIPQQQFTSLRRFWASWP